MADKLFQNKRKCVIVIAKMQVERATVSCVAQSLDKPLDVM